ncbi:MAG: DNA polymerase Y family protein [Geminicoccaceae bacterium]
MTRRCLSLWLTDWPIERMRLSARRRGRPFPPAEAPFALVAPDRGVPRLTALSAAAKAKGLRPGMNLADARAAVPSLLIAEAEPEADAKALEALALWAGRWSPWVRCDGADGLLLDLTGCAHLFGGEAGLLDAVQAGLDGLGFTARLAIADGAARAWAWARFGEGGIAPQGTPPFHDLPVEALRLEPDTAAGLRRLGFRRIGQLAPLPRQSLLVRFGAALALRLDLVLDGGDEPFVAVRAPARFAARLGWAEPIGHTEAILLAARRLLDLVCRELEHAQQGARRVELSLGRVDGAVARIAAGTARPVRAPDHLLRLLAPDLDGLDIGFGIEVMRLDVLETSPLGASQAELAARNDPAALDRLLDQLARRLGRHRVLRLAPVDSHWPERAQRLVPAGTLAVPEVWPLRQPRPLRLLEQPRPVTAMAVLPDGPPLQIDGRRLLAATGPERLLPEWWRPDPEARPRDYFRITDASGRQLWTFREGTYGDATPPAWRVHGLFA